MTGRDLFLANARGEFTDRVPIWIMRQAGRYLPEYRAVREKASFEDICRTPSLATEVTMQPIERFGFDAAIIFSDILFILEPLGISLKYNPGPVISPLLESPGQSDRFEEFDPAEKLFYVGEAITQTRKILGDETALLGFCGAPFTLLSYLCGTVGRSGYHNAVRFLSSYPDEGEKVLGLLARVSVKYLKMQLKSGADAVQVFDTWAGELSGSDFDRWALPYLKIIMDDLHDNGYLTSIYIRHSGHLLDRLKDLKTNIISLDWKTSFNDASRILEPKTLQGNLNPASMLGPTEQVINKAEEILNDMKNYPGFIFNLGHGILPDTPIENVQALVQTVRKFERSK
jgi:uroporphyrinogen decarboxylase